MVSSYQCASMKMSCKKKRFCKAKNTCIVPHSNEKGRFYKATSSNVREDFILGAEGGAVRLNGRNAAVC